MKVLLTKDVYKLGRAGDIKKVADGYGRNYLLPQGLANETDNFAALRRGNHSPPGEGVACVGRNVLVVLSGAGTDGSDGFAGGRIDRLDQRSGRMVRPPVFADASSRIDGLDAQRLERGMDGAHR